MYRFHRPACRLWSVSQILVFMFLKTYRLYLLFQCIAVGGRGTISLLFSQFSLIQYGWMLVIAVKSNESPVIHTVLLFCFSVDCSCKVNISQCCRYAYIPSSNRTNLLLF